METWRRGDVETRGRGDVETWRRGDVETWRRGDVGTWRRGDVGTRTRYDTDTIRYGARRYNATQWFVRRYGYDTITVAIRPDTIRYDTMRWRLVTGDKLRYTIYDTI